MNPYTFFWKSSIGKKWLVALTGLVLLGYVVGHMIGNLQIFGPPAKINGYAEMLHSMPAALWAVRAFLIVCFVLHIVATIKLVIENRAARPAGYTKFSYGHSKLATRLMALSGLTVLAFVIFHILHFTTRSVDPALHPAKPGTPGVLAGEYDVHTMVIHGFRDHPFITGFYLVGLLLLGLHLSHGISSLAQTFGLNSSKTMTPLSTAGRIIAFVLFIGYALIPVAVWLRYLNPVQP